MQLMQRTNTRRRERGTAAVELAVAAPFLMLIVMVVVAGGRLELARGAVQQAAVDAARAASIARTAEAAAGSAAATAEAVLANQGLRCAGSQVTVDTGGFGLPVGTPARVAATVSCTVPLADLGVPGLPGDRTITATAYSPLDTYRGRS